MCGDIQEMFNQVKIIKEDQYWQPIAAEAIQKCHYVDDFVMSFNSEEEPLLTTSNVKEIHSKGGFHLRQLFRTLQKFRED